MTVREAREELAMLQSKKWFGEVLRDVLRWEGIGPYLTAVDQVNRIAELKAFITLKE